MRLYNARMPEQHLTEDDQIFYAKPVQVDVTRGDTPSTVRLSLGESAIQLTLREARWVEYRLREHCWGDIASLQAEEQAFQAISPRLNSALANESILE